MLDWLVHERGIEPHIPVFDKSQRTDGTFSRDDFAYDHKRDCYICPAGKELRLASTDLSSAAHRSSMKDGMMRYRASKLRLRGLPAEAALLPERAGAQDPALDPRRRPRHGARHRQDRGLPDLTPPAQEGRDAVRPPQAHPEARSPAITRAERRPRRVPPRRHRPEPPEARQADPGAGADRQRPEATRRSPAWPRPPIRHRVTSNPTSSTEITP